MKGQIHTSWSELEKPMHDLGVLGALFTIGDADDDSATRVGRYYFPPGVRVAPHTHDADYAEIILEGTQQVTRRWHRAGDIRIVKAGTAYGPLIAGPEGVTVLVIFRRKQSGAVPARRDQSELVIDLVPT